MQYEEVIREIARRNQLISQYQFCRYKANLDSTKTEYLFPEETFRMHRDDIRLGFVDDLRTKHFSSNEHVIGLTSLVVINGSEFHLDMIDFCCEKSEEGLRDVRDTLTSLRMRRGFVMDSGNSYHYLGFSFRSKPEFLQLMGRLSGYSCIGPNWSYYQQLKEFGVLRITPCFKFGKQIPQLVERFDDLQLYFSFVE